MRHLFLAGSFGSERTRVVVSFSSSAVGWLLSQSPGLADQRLLVEQTDTPGTVIKMRSSITASNDS